jgi:hypothetical protein
VQYVQQYQPNHPVGSLDSTVALTFLQIPIMMPGYVPKMVFIDRGGVIRHQYTGEDQYFTGDQYRAIRGTLEELLKPPSPTRKSTASHKEK